MAPKTPGLPSTEKGKTKRVKGGLPGWKQNENDVKKKQAAHSDSVGSKRRVRSPHVNLTSEMGVERKGRQKRCRDGERQTTINTGAQSMSKEDHTSRTEDRGGTSTGGQEKKVR